MYDDKLINRQEEAAKGTRNYWLCLFMFDAMVKGATTSTEETPNEHMNKLREEHERRSDFPKQQRKRYAEQRGRIQRKKRKRELQAEANDEFKCNALRASLITGQQNASAFHAFTAPFCTMNNQLAPKPLQLPEIPHLTKVVLEDDDEEEGL